MRQDCSVLLNIASRIILGTIALNFHSIRALRKLLSAILEKINRGHPTQFFLIIYLIAEEWHITWSRVACDIWNTYNQSYRGTAIRVPNAWKPEGLLIFKWKCETMFWINIFTSVFFILQHSTGKNIANWYTKLHFDRFLNIVYDYVNSKSFTYKWMHMHLFRSEGIEFSISSGACGEGECACVIYLFCISSAPRVNGHLTCYTYFNNLLYRFQ